MGTSRLSNDISKRVAVAVDVFNVLNHPDFTGYVGNIRSPLFGLPTTASAGRRAQPLGEQQVLASL